jgi:hypothetical protein
MYHSVLGQMKKQLGQIDGWLDKAEAHAKANGFDPNAFTTYRLAPDQFAFSRQIDGACDSAKFAAMRLTGKEAPKNDDDEKTIAELRARVKSAITYLDGITEADFAGAATRTISNPRWEGRTMTGHDYFFEHALGNFYFHLTHAYAILRHAGVALGKRDYLGPLTQTKA